MLLPDPPHDPRWLDLATTTGGGPPTRIVLPAAAGQTRPPAATDVTIGQTPTSPGEHLLSTIAARLLAAVPPLPHDPWRYGTAPRPRQLPGIADGLGDVITALQACGALPPHSPVPGQLAALCARLNVTGHGITTPPARDLPEPWLSVLTQYQHRETGAAPVRDGCAVAAVVLPELDGIQLAILGLHNCQDSTIVHMHASGPMCDVIYGPDELYAWVMIWIRDSDGRWHATRTSWRPTGFVDNYIMPLAPFSCQFRVHTRRASDTPVPSESSDDCSTLPRTRTKPASHARRSSMHAGG